jgi:hypothetical protein
MKEQAASQTVGKLTKKVILLTITALALPMSAAFALTTTTWTDGTGNWSDCSNNWDNGCPDSATAAQINNGGTAQTGVNAPQARALSLTLALNPGQSGAVEVNPPFGDLIVDEAIFVGYRGTGKLTVRQSLTSGTASIASLTNEVGGPSYGTATVDGSTWTVTGAAEVGGYNGNPGGTALLLVTNSGTVTAANVHVYGSGTLTGNAAVSTTNGTTVDGTLAPNGGGGTLTISGNLSLTSGATHATTQCNVTPQDPSTTPQVSVSGQVSLGGLLSVTMTGDFSSAPTRFTLLYANSVNSLHNTFDFTSITYPTGHCWHPIITYDYTGGHVHVYLDRVYDCN